jgi:hypothetical protein
MEQAVERSSGHDGIVGEHVAPFGEGLVPGEDEGLFSLVALADDLEPQQACGRSSVR